MSRSYTANYNGKPYNMTAYKWYHFLADKPVYEHVTDTCMRARLDDRENNGLTIGQCLGITEYQSKHSSKGKSGNAVSPVEMDKFVLVNSLLNRIAVRRVLCQN